MGEKVIYTLTRSDVIIEDNKIIDIKTICIVFNSLEKARAEMAEHRDAIKEFEEAWQEGNTEKEIYDNEADCTSLMYYSQKNTHGYWLQIEGKEIKGKEINDDDIWEIYDAAPYSE